MSLDASIFNSQYYTHDLTGTTINRDMTVTLTANSDRVFWNLRVRATTNRSSTDTNHYSTTTHPEIYNSDFTVLTLDFSLPIWDWLFQKYKYASCDFLGQTDPAPEPQGLSYTEELEFATTDFPDNVINKDSNNGVINIFAVDGYILELVRVTFSTPNYNEFDFKPESSNIYNEDKTKATLPLNDSKFGSLWDSEYQFKISVVAKEFIDDEFVTSFINIYKADIEVLDAISGQRFMGDAGVESDLGTYIYKLYSLPVPIPDNLLSKEKQDIRLGGSTLSTKAFYLLKNKYVYDLGNIEIPEIYGNVFDYKDTTCLLHSPYIEPIEIDNSYVIGCNINIKYSIDLYTGFTSINISSSKIENDVFIRREISFIRNIPVMNKTTEEVKGDIGNYVYNDLNKAYIEVVRNIPYSDTDTLLGLPTYEYGQIGQYVGYVEVDNIDIHSQANDIEKQEISQLMKQGVYIND